jgi:hypothetical protein
MTFKLAILADRLQRKCRFWHRFKAAFSFVDRSHNFALSLLIADHTLRFYTLAMYM